MENIPEPMLAKYRKQLSELLKIPKIEQKTQEWYDMRYNLITASDFAQALGEGKFGTQRQLIEKKVLPLESKPISNIFFEWGHMFEPLASRVYSDLYGKHVYEFGLIKHPKYDFFGASPDGISEDGVMLEIKCPLRRKITGDIPTQYYYQIQGQLDVCGLDICDYLECEFQSFKTYEEYADAYQHGQYTGVIKENKGGANEEEKYVYKSFQKCICNRLEEQVSYWILKKYNIVRVTKDAAFVEEKLKELGKVWEKIVYYRNHPNDFQMEVKQSIHIETELYNKVPQQKCMIVDLD